MAEQSNSLDALQAVLQALEPLDDDEKMRVLEGATAYLGINLGTKRSEPSTSTSFAKGTVDHLEPVATARVVDIRTLKDEKQPRSANEMAALVAYYLDEHAPGEEHRESIGQEQIRKYFKQAGFPLPQKLSNTMTNAAAAGYLESVGHGQYRLNPVGYNLVAHHMPTSRASVAMTGHQPRKKKKRPSKKKSSKKRPVKKA